MSEIRNLPNPGTQNMPVNARKKDELIAWWAYLVAITVFVAFQWMMNVFVPRQPNPPPEGFRIAIGIVGGLFLGALMLLVGYVNKDAERRGMNKWLWTVLVFFIPNGIGFILYFLTRQPMRVTCGNCGTIMPPNYRFCPKCAAPRLAVCGHCGTPTQPGDLFCNHCGRMLHEPVP